MLRSAHSPCLSGSIVMAPFRGILGLLNGWEVIGTCGQQCTFSGVVSFRLCLQNRTCRFLESWMGLLLVRRPRTPHLVSHGVCQREMGRRSRRSWSLRRCNPLLHLVVRQWTRTVSSLQGQ